MRILNQISNRFRQWLLQSQFKRLLLGRGPQPGPLRLSYKDVYILPTGAGLMYGVMLFLMLIASINYSNSLGYLFTFLLASVVLLAIIHTYRNLCQLVVDVSSIESGFAGGSVRVSLLVENPGQMKYAVSLSNDNGVQQRVDLSEYAKTRLLVEEPVTQRGWAPLSKLTFETRYPLGLFKAWAYVHFDQRILVYPEPLGHGLALRREQHTISQLGDQGQGVDDFVGLRLFQMGDSYRHVHWKACAHEHHLLTKQFGGNSSDEIWLDFRDYADLPLEMRLSQLCRLVLEADREHLDYGLWLPGTSFNPAKGDRHRQQCLRALALYGVAA